MLKVQFAKNHQMPENFHGQNKTQDLRGRYGYDGFAPSLLWSRVFSCGYRGMASAQAVLPQPLPPFKGKIGTTVAKSTPDFPKEVEAPKGAPNVLLILTDDVGFGASSVFGGPIQTPNFQRLADSGLRYNMFHTTALCSPTRAALITGRNHHSVASGVITEMATGYPGYDSLVPRARCIRRGSPER
jgi:Sulfatase